MKTRKDQLIEFAFGELNEAEQKNMNLTARERLEANEFANLRSDLGRLREVPECQISAERIRDAVLKAEIRQRRDWRRWLPIAAVPVAAAAVFAVLAMIKMPGTTPPSLVTAESGPVAKVEKSHPDFVKAIDGDAVLATIGSLVDDLPIAVDTPRVSIVRQDTRPRMMAARYARRRPARKVETPTEDKAIVAKSVPAPTAQPEPIVMISNENDANTGARRASEVETSSDVVIGG